MANPIAKSGRAVAVTVAYAGVAPCSLLGIYLNSAAVPGIIYLFDGPDAFDPIVYFIPALGWNEVPCSFGASLLAVKDGTQNFTLFFAT